MPTEFLTDDQLAQYGRFYGAPSRVQRERLFFLDDADRALIARRRRPHLQLGFALQLVDGWSSQDVGPGNKGSDALATECVQCRNLGAFSPT